MQMLSKIPANFVFTKVDRKVAEASYKDNEIQALLPESVNLDLNKDLFGIIFEVAVVGKFNKNDDAVMAEDILPVLKCFNHKLIDVYHDTFQNIGHIVESSPKRYKESVLISEKQAAKEKIFSIVLGGVIYNRICSYDVHQIIRSTSPESTNYGSYSASWEMGFSDFDIAVCEGENTSAYDCEIIKSDSEEYSYYLKFLRANGGNGMLKDGRLVKRILRNLLPLGAGIVTNPAADVEEVESVDEIKREMKSSTASYFEGFSYDQNWIEIAVAGCGKKSKGKDDDNDDEKDDNDDEDDDEDDKDDDKEDKKNKNLSKKTEDSKAKCGNNEKNKASNSKNKESKSNINVNIFEDSKKNNMDKVEILNSLEWGKESKASELYDILESKFVQANEEFVEKLKKEEKEKEALANEAKKASEDIASMRQEIAQMAKERREAKAKELFQNRMADMSEAFKMSDEERKVVASKIQKLDESDASYEEFKNEMGVLWNFKEKTEADEKNLKDKLKESQASIRQDISNNTQPSDEIKKDSVEYFKSKITIE